MTNKVLKAQGVEAEEKAQGQIIERGLIVRCQVAGKDCDISKVLVGFSG